MAPKKQIILLAALFCALFKPSPSAAQDSGQQDSLVRLIKATSLQLIEQNGLNFRKTVDATFLHNGTYLICDTALWDVDRKIINCMGHVSVVQGETELTSDSLRYSIDDNLAQFRGTLVQMSNQKDNILRTHFLDYNTKDSLAVFSRGAAMRDKDGQLIESIDGTYDSSQKLFTFTNEVNMFTDSAFIKTRMLQYDSNADKASFPEYVDFWHEGNMLSAKTGWYNHKSEIFFFRNNVHGLTEEQEFWGDTLYIYRNTKSVKMLGNVQIQDTLKKVATLSNYVLYEDSLSRVTLANEASVAMFTEQDNVVDTLYVGADTIIYDAVPKCVVPPAEKVQAKARKELILFDPIAEFRKKAAAAATEAAAKASEKTVADGPGKRPFGPPADFSDDGFKPGSKTKPEPEPETKPEKEDKPYYNDSLVMAVKDSLARIDSIAATTDSSRVGFVTCIRNVKAYRRDIQLKCDSMHYCDLDSIARFYLDPIVWNEGNRQYSSDSMHILVRDKGMDRASLMSNAFIITREDSLCFDQIRGTDVMAYFDTTSNLSRFDALGGATAMFYIKEKETFATVNKVEAKMLSGLFKDGDIDKIYYFDAPKNNAYPVAQLPRSDKFLKGYNWQPEKRPNGKADITDLELIASQRALYEAHPKATFVQTEKYFPGYVEDMYKSLEEARLRRAENEKRDKAEKDRAKALKIASDAAALALADSLAHIKPVTDTLSAKDTLAAVDSLAKSDTLAVKDSASVKDSSSVAAAAAVLSATEIRAAEKAKIRAEKAAKREEAAKLRQEKRDAKWAAKDAADKAKADAKAAKKLEQQRLETYKQWKKEQRQNAIDQKKLEDYKQKYLQKKNKEDAKNGKDTRQIP